MPHLQRQGADTAVRQQELFKRQVAHGEMRYAQFVAAREALVLIAHGVTDVKKVASEAIQKCDDIERRHYEA